MLSNDVYGKPRLSLVIVSILGFAAAGVANDADPNLVAWWQFEEGSGPTAYDSVGSNHGTLMNGPVWTDGPVGGALSFDGEDDYVLVPDTPSLRVTGQLTLAARIYLASLGDQGIVAKSGLTAGSDGDYYLSFSCGDASDSQVVFGVNGNCVADNIAVSDPVIQTGRWHHIVGTYNYGEMKVYVDGNLEGTKSSPDSIPATTKDLIIGAYGSTDWMLDGIIDDVRIYDRALLLEEVEQLYIEGLSSKAINPNPVKGALGVTTDAVLSWTPGKDALSHDVYFGTDYNDVNDANTTVTLGVYAGNQNLEANSYDPCGLELATTYYWRVDEVNDPCIWKGDVWSFTVAVMDLEHVIVYYEADKFAGWPANNGLLWNWGDDEVLVGFTRSDFLCQGGHNSTGTEYSVLGRSMDGGNTWTVEDPDNFVGDGGTPSPSPGNINFADPNFTMRVVGTAYNGSDLPQGAFYFSYDRGATWQGPYEMGNFGESTVDSWEKTPRTDYIVNGPNDCMVFMSARPIGGEFGTDRAFCVRTTDSGATFQFQGWMVPPSDPYRGVMPSTVRCSPTKLVSALRRRNMSAGCDAWVDVYVSNDNGVTWAFLSEVGETGCENGNPPALVRLSDTRLCCVYGNRTDMRMYMKYSEDEGATWGEQIILRDDWADCADDRQDLGYPRITQLPNGRIIAAYYWSTPDHIENHIAATIWEPGDTSHLSVARYPHPTDGASDVPPDVVLSWRPGVYAAGSEAHDVYIGTDFDDVNGASTSSDEHRCSLALEANSYDPCGLELATTYYWRIDENNDANSWKGDIWSFTTADYLIVDDMEDYTGFGGENPISLGPCGWECGYTNNTGAYIDLWTESPTRGTQAMRYAYVNNENNGLGYYSEIKSQCLDPCDWSALNEKSLTLWFYGDPDNDANATEQMYVAVEDDNNTYVEVRYGDHGEDMNDIKIAEWQEWNIDLNDFNDGGVMLSDVNYMYIGFGQRYSAEAGGLGTVYFDDIRLYAARCVPEFSLAADFTDDCLVDFGDFAIIADQWLKAPGSPSADIAQPPDGIVDMWDLELLVDDWLQEKLWPQ